jgi:hypothetical protein
MARIRTIKPDFWTDEKLTDCSLSARLLFIGTWNFADDAGNLDRSHKQIKARVFPLDNVDCEPLLLELITQGLLIEYAVEGKQYLHIKGFEKHQLINRPSKPTCPSYEDSVSAHAGRKGRKGKEGNSGTKEKPEYSEDFLKFWDAYPNKSSKAKANESWLKIKPSIEQVLSTLSWQVKTSKWLEKNGEFIPMASTYINQQRWLDEKSSGNGAASGNDFKKDFL